MGFEEQGWVRLEGAFDPTGMAEAMWRALAKHEMRPHDPSTWRQDHGQPVSPGKWLTKFGKSGVFSAVSTDAVQGAPTDLLGEGWTETGRWGGPLVTFPSDEAWDVPTGGWHLDMPPAAPLQAIRMFAYLNEVRERGGGTLIVEGSHRLTSAYPGLSSRAVRERLSEQYSWFREVWRPTDRERRLSMLMDLGADLDGVRVRVVELTGAPGDVVLWHPSLLHAAAPNSSDWPRFMLTHTALRCSP